MSKKREKRTQTKTAWERKKIQDRKRKKKPKSVLPAKSFAETQKFLESQGIINCWNCGRELKAPDWVRKLAERGDGEKTNNAMIGCTCGEQTAYKW